MPDPCCANEVPAAEPAASASSLRKKLLTYGPKALGLLAFIPALVLPGMDALAHLVLFLLAYLLIGGDVLLSALKNITRGQIFDENFLMATASVGAFAIGERPEAVAGMLFYQVGEFFQDLALRRSRRSISSLMDIRPDFANLRLADGSTRQVDPASVEVGATIIVRAGEKVPLDSVVLEGSSSLDVAALTGESLPRDVSVGDRVLSGSINTRGLLTLRTQASFGESTVSKILTMVQEAGTKKAPVENFITKFARYYTPTVVGGAAALALLPPLLIPGAQWSVWISRALVFLVVSCPCALVISIPLSFFGGIGGASRQGVLVKGGNYLNALTRVKTFVFDKTGTLTRGEFSVQKVVPATEAGCTQAGLLHLAAAAEAHSTHPIARSITGAWSQDTQSTPYGSASIPATDDRVHPAGGGSDDDSDEAPGVDAQSSKSSEDDGFTVSEHHELAGFGVRARVGGDEVLVGNERLLQSDGIAFEPVREPGSIVYIARGGQYLGYMLIVDELKPDSKDAIAGLRKLGIKHMIMLTGDNADTARSVAADLGIDTIYAELLPQDKVSEIERLEGRQKDGELLAFVGDGINDAPVLARAQIGIAMGALGSDAAVEAADVVLMTDEPRQLTTAVRIARKTQRIVWQNIVFALGVKGVILLLSALGISTMWEAVFGDVGVALLATLNASRAMRSH
jgi:Cd2+/Zn2+-exporting ATPase